jgi:hypothetical protein
MVLAAQHACHLADVFAFPRLEGLIQDDGPDGDDPGRQFVLEVRRTSTLPDGQMKAGLSADDPSVAHIASSNMLSFYVHLL